MEKSFIRIIFFVPFLNFIYLDFFGGGGGRLLIYESRKIVREKTS